MGAVLAMGLAQTIDMVILVRRGQRNSPRCRNLWRTAGILSFFGVAETLVLSGLLFGLVELVEHPGAFMPRGLLWVSLAAANAGLMIVWVMEWWRDPQGEFFGYIRGLNTHAWIERLMTNQTPVGRRPF